MTKHVQLDLETLGLKPGAMILTIGVVVFDFENKPGGDEQGEFYCHVDLEYQKRASMTIDPETLVFWMGQEGEARNEIVEGQANQATPVHIALASLNEFLEGICEQDLEDPEVKALDLKVWSNGANFDAPILREMYDRFGVRCPWGWWNERCHRTAAKEYRNLLDYMGVSYESESPARQSVVHNALEDARYQAETLTFLYQKLLTTLRTKTFTTHPIS